MHDYLLVIVTFDISIHPGLNSHKQQERAGTLHVAQDIMLL